MQRYKQLTVMAAAAIMGLGAAGAAHAQGFGGYIGASVGQADTDASDLDSSTGFRILGGYMYNDNFGVEVGYMDIGEFDGNSPTSNASIEADGAYVAGVGVYPLSDRFNLFGKVGLFHYEYDVLVNGSSVENNDGTEMLLGLGVDYSLTPAIAIGAEYNQVSDIDESDVDAIWLNVRYNMGLQ